MGRVRKCSQTIFEAHLAALIELLPLVMIHDLSIRIFRPCTCASPECFLFVFCLRRPRKQVGMSTMRV